MGATVGVNHRLHFAVIQRSDRGIQHRVDQFSVGACSDRLTHHHSIKAIDHGREVVFADGQLELRDVGQPLLVTRSGVEVAV